jgi:hypothetical protein
MSTIKSSAENLTLNADGANNDIKFQSNGSEVASIDQAGLVTSAGATMSGVLTVNAGGNLGFQANGTTYTQVWQTLQSPNDLVLKTTANKYISFQPNSTEKVRIHSSGVTSFNNGIELGSGLDATAANTLDDYEEGTWTPVMKDTSDRALSTNTGSSGAIYVKIGRQVTVTGRITTDSVGSAAGQLMLTGLPFAAYGSSLGGYSGGTVGRAGNLNIASGTNIAFAVTYGQTHCEMTRWDDSVGTTDMQVSEWSADGWIMFCLVYQTA